MQLDCCKGSCDLKDPESAPAGRSRLTDHLSFCQIEKTTPEAHEIGVPRVRTTMTPGSLQAGHPPIPSGRRVERMPRAIYYGTTLSCHSIVAEGFSHVAIYVHRP